MYRPLALASGSSAFVRHSLFGGGVRQIARNAVTAGNTGLLASLASVTTELRNFKLSKETRAEGISWSAQLSTAVVPKGSVERQPAELMSRQEIIERMWQAEMCPKSLTELRKLWPDHSEQDIEAAIIRVKGDSDACSSIIKTAAFSINLDTGLDFKTKHGFPSDPVAAVYAIALENPEDAGSTIHLYAGKTAFNTQRNLSGRARHHGQSISKEKGNKRRLIPDILDGLKGRPGNADFSEVYIDIGQLLEVLSHPNLLGIPSQSWWALDDGGKKTPERTIFEDTLVKIIEAALLGAVRFPCNIRLQGLR